MEKGSTVDKAKGKSFEVINRRYLMDKCEFEVWIVPAGAGVLRGLNGSAEQFTKLKNDMKKKKNNNKKKESKLLANWMRFEG